MRYKCLTCGEMFADKMNCVHHHFEKGHEVFELIKTDIRITIKTK